MGSRILLADDSITIQKVVNLTFAEEGIEVVAVSNGDLAEKRLSEVKPDLVLADIFMPGKNGYELCDAIKQSPQFRNVPVVLLVGAFEPFDSNEARRVRADAHLTKPFESHTLVETVRRLINSTPERATGPLAPVAMPEDAGGPARTTGPMASDSDVSSAVRTTTDELASTIAFTSQSISDVGFERQPEHSNVAADVAETGEGFEMMELPPAVDSLETAPTVDPLVDSQEMVLDFDKTEVASARGPDDVLSFDSREGALLEMEVAGMTDEVEWLGSRNGDAGRFTMPAEPVEVEVTTPLNNETPDFEFDSDLPAPAESSTSVLLAGDDPLGDVLDDGGVALSHAADVPSAGALEVDLPTHEAHQADAADAGSFNLIESDSKAVNAGGNAPAADEHSVPGPGAGSTGDLEWTTPRAQTYSTAQLDSLAMSIEARERIDQVVVNGKEPMADEVSGFAGTGAPPEEEAQFAAIDIEAVDEPATSADRAGEFETGFAFSSVSEGQPAVQPEVPPPAELSAAAIEAIVRRVIAQMSESVVREVAWEVVPDCVERVIGQMTRESLSRRA